MPDNDSDSRFGKVSVLVAGAAGVVLTFLAAWGWWILSGRWHLLSSSLFVVGLAAGGFGLGVLALAVAKRLSKKDGRRRRWAGRRTTISPLANRGGSRRHDPATVAALWAEEPRRPAPDPQSGRPTPPSPWIKVAVASVIGVLLLSSAALSLAWLGGDGDEGEERKSDTRRASKNEIDQKMDQLRAKLPYLSIKDVTTKNGGVLKLLNGDAKPAETPTAQYMVSVQDKYVGQVHIFDAKEYVMASSPANVDDDVRDICRSIDKSLEGQDDILKALQDMQLKGSLSLSLFGVVDAGIESSPPKIFLVNLAALARALAGLPAKKVEVLVKGYADGQKGPWTKALRQKPYNYDVVNVYMRDEPDKIDSFNFIRSEQPVRIDDPYSNRHLPELRGRFVAENFIGKFLKGCEGSTETEVHILQGYARDSDVIREPERRVEVYVNVY